MVQSTSLSGIMLINWRLWVSTSSIVRAGSQKGLGRESLHFYKKLWPYIQSEQSKIYNTLGEAKVEH